MSGLVPASSDTSSCRSAPSQHRKPAPLQLSQHGAADQGGMTDRGENFWHPPQCPPPRTQPSQAGGPHSIAPASQNGSPYIPLPQGAAPGNAFSPNPHRSDCGTASFIHQYALNSLSFHLAFSSAGDSLRGQEITESFNQETPRHYKAISQLSNTKRAKCNCA